MMVESVGLQEKTKDETKERRFGTTGTAICLYDEESSRVSLVNWEGLFPHASSPRCRWTFQEFRSQSRL